MEANAQVINKMVLLNYGKAYKITVDAIVSGGKL